MRVYTSIIFLTLVLSNVVSVAVPTSSEPLRQIQISPKESSEPIFSTSENIERDWSIRIGFLGGALKETHQAEQLYFYGLRYEFLRESLNTWTIEVTAAKNNFVHLVLGKKFYFPLEDVTRPYYKLSLGDLIDSTVGIGSVFNIKKIQAMAAVGLDDIFRWDRRLQAEVGVSYALIGPQFEASIGVAF